MIPQRTLFVSMGALQKPKDEFERALKGGLALEEARYLGELQQQGKLQLAGVWADYSSGLLFLSVGSLAEAQALVRNQPVVKAGFIAGDVKEFISVDYAAGLDHKK